MKKISFSELSDNMFDAIGKEWMLVTAGDKESFNMMTANWGGTGYLWHKPVAFAFIRPERYTYEFTERHDRMTLSFFGDTNKKALQICGSRSGRDIDKVKETGLTPVETENGSMAFEQARMVIEGRKLYSTMLREGDFIERSVFEKWYGGSHGNLHRMYIIEIENIYVK